MTVMHINHTGYTAVVMFQFCDNPILICRTAMDLGATGPVDLSGGVENLRR
jgi:hypothetical protein